MPKVDLAMIAQTNATGYPSRYAGEMEGRWYRRLGTALGLEDFGVSHVVLKPGAASSQRHWHEDEDEFVVILSGEAVLVEEGGRTPLVAGDMAAFVKGEPDAHQLVNEGQSDCAFLAIGRTPRSDAHYPDIDLQWSRGVYRHKNGSCY